MADTFRPGDRVILRAGTLFASLGTLIERVNPEHLDGEWLVYSEDYDYSVVRYERELTPLVEKKKKSP